MDSPGNFCMYDSEYYTEKDLDKPDQVFLFGNEDDSMNFGGLADYTGLFQNENSIDLNAYINPSTSPTNGFIQLSDLLPSSPSKSTLPTELPPLIRPEEAEAAPGAQPNARQIAQSTLLPSVTVANLPDSMPSSHPQFMPQPQLDCTEGAAALQVKAEPTEQVEPASRYYTDDYDDDDDDASTYTSGPSRPATPILKSPVQRGRKSSKSSSSRRVRLVLDKESEEYRQKRVKNNIAVRRSREKSKAKSLELQSKVKELTSENERLNKRVELLTKELTVLKSLFTNVGKSAPTSLANMQM
ncbi:CCAAT/enhancer-binding protein alpha-like [Acanthaster planci]|uniref:CCAAT/enhancer-binding protein alpha-like n=1 Tax=Acanthaster planci TaxID=133434 RepID=A0A8B8A5M4_ACAPL|nr:CCAAT/enhancer-binding protein alpha-like [Acanthaster planci]